MVLDYSTRLYRVLLSMVVAVDGNRTDHSMDRGWNCNAVDIVAHRIVIVAVVVHCTIVVVDNHGASRRLVAGSTHGNFENGASFDDEPLWSIFELRVA